MTRGQIIKRLDELGFGENSLYKYYEIYDFLKYNRTPIKYVDKIKIADESGRDSSYWTVYIQLYGDPGWLEV